MTDEETLLAAILARPLDDQVRLGYADWLEETATRERCPQCYGDGLTGYGEGFRPSHQQCPACDGTGEVSNGHAERAEFIRVQCELATLGTFVLRTLPRAANSMPSLQRQRSYSTRRPPPPRAGDRRKAW